MRNLFAMIRNFLVILAIFVALSVFGGTTIISNPHVMLVAVVLFGGGMAAAFGHRRLGGTRIGRNILETHGPVFVIGAVYSALIYLPLGYIGGWFWDLPAGIPTKVLIFDFALLFVFALWSRLPPAPAFPWAPLVAVCSALARWGFAFIEAARVPASGLAFIGTPPIWAEVVYTGSTLVFAAAMSAVVIVAIVGCTVLKDHGIWWKGFFADNVAVFWMSGSSIRRIAMSLSLEPVRFPTARNIVEEALRTGNFELIENAQLAAVFNPPDGDTSAWTLQDWDDFYGGRNYLQWVNEQLDVSAYGDPDINCLPDGYYPGLPGFVSPYEHIEGGLEIEHDGHKMPKNMMDLRTSGPVSVWSETITVEHGFELSCRASYRIRPVLLPRVAHCKGRQAIIDDRVKNALNQIMQIVGPWLYGFVGEPLQRGSLQRGLVVDQAARGGTPFTRRTSMVTRPARQEDVPQLVDADRPAYFAVVGIVYNLHLTVLRETGMWIVPDSFQIDDVDVDVEVKKILLAAVKAVILTSVAPELRTLGFVATQAKMGGIVSAIQGLGLTPDQQTEILKEAAKLLTLNGGSSSDLLVLAGQNVGIKTSGDGGGKK